MKSHGLCIVCISALLAGWSAQRVSAQTPIYVNAVWAGTSAGVDPDGSGPATSFGSDAFATLQSAVAAAGVDDTLYIAGGTYTLSSTLNLSSIGLTLIGPAKDSVTIDASGIAGYGIAVSANRVTLDGVTLLGPAGSPTSADYGIKASHMDTLTIRDVAVTGSGRSEIDLNTVNTGLLENVTADGSNTAGVGIALSHSSNITLRDVTTTGNDWGGVGLFDTNAGATSDIVFDGTCTFGENNPIYIDAEFGKGVTNITLPTGFDYAVRNGVFRDSEGPDRSEAFTFFQSSKANAISFALSLQTSPYPDNLSSYIQGVGTDGTLQNTFTVGHGMNVQVAIDSAVPGATISIGAGIFDETIALNKRVSLVGAGSDTTGTILQSTSGPTQINTSPYQFKPVVIINASGTSGSPILLEGLRIRPRQDLVSGQLPGILISSGEVSYLTLNDVIIAGTKGSGTAEAGLAVGDSASVSHLTVTGCTFQDMAYGMIFYKNLNNTTVAENISVSNSVFLGNSIKGFYAEKLSDATFSNVTVTENGDTSLSPSWADPWNAGIDINLKFGSYQNLAFNDLTVENNGVGSANGVGISIKARGTGSDPSYSSNPATIDGVSLSVGMFSGNPTNVRFGEPGKDNTSPTGITVRGLSISGSSRYGISNQLSGVSIDAIRNYWGAPTGPKSDSNSAGDGDTVSAGVTFDPWYIDTARTAVVASQQVVLTEDTTTVGTPGIALTLKITSTPDANNNLVAYQAGSVADPPVTTETLPAGIQHRAAIIWGFKKKGSVTADLVFDYSGIPGITDPSALRLIKRSNPHSPWADITDQFTNDTDNMRFVGVGISTFSEFTVGGGGDNALPVQLASLTARARKAHAILRWSTVSETSCYGFEVERRPVENQRKVTWGRVGFVRGAGTSVSLHSYEFTDDVPIAGHYAYRIKQIDTDGTFRYTAAIELVIDAVPTGLTLAQNFPNPFNPATRLTFTIPVSGQVSLKVYDMLGRQVSVLVAGYLKAGTHEVSFDAGNLPSGIYFCRLQAGSETRIRQMILVR